MCIDDMFWVRCGSVPNYTWADASQLHLLVTPLQTHTAPTCLFKHPLASCAVCLAHPQAISDKVSAALAEKLDLLRFTEFKLQVRGLSYCADLI